MNRSNFFWWSILVFVFLIPISQMLSSGVLVAIFVLSFFIDGKISIVKYLTQGWDAWLYLLMLVIGLSYTDDHDMGILALPFIVVKIKEFDKKRLYEIFYSFIAGLVIASFICFGNAANHYFNTGDISVFSSDQLTSALDNTHPIYFAYYLIFAITFGLYLLYYKDSRFSNLVIILLLIIFFITLLLLGSSTAALSVLFSFLYFILKFLFESTRTSNKIIAFGWALFFLICLFTASWMDDLGNLGLRQDDYWERFILWESAMNAMPNWIVGVGTGDYTSVLNQYYLTHGLSHFAVSNFNPHNQYIEILFSLGLAGFVALMLMICRPIYYAIKKQNILGFLTFFPFLIYGMTEVYLGRYQGVVFFAILHQAFISFYRGRENSFPIEK